MGTDIVDGADRTSVRAPGAARRTMEPARPRPRARLLAWALAAAATSLQIGGYALYAAADALALEAADLFTSGLALAFAAVGALVAAQRPGNTIGWILLAVAVSTGLGGFAHGYVAYELAGGASAGAVAATAATYAEISWIPFVLVPPSFLVLLFPDGHLPSHRWRPVAWAAAAGIAAAIATSWTTPGTLADFPQLLNPYGIEGPLRQTIEIVSNVVLLAAVFGCTASVIVRFRNGSHEQRQQIKWLAAAGALAAPTLAVNVMLYDAVGADLANGLIMVTVLGIPLAVGIAILRHRLYDIDVVINRALVYGALTATLAAAYLATVLLLQLILSGITAGSDIAIASSTLGVAALFRPARRRIQRSVDRRFYRHRYDAARTLAGFGARLRDETDLDALADELRAVIGQTMQPAHVCLWVRDPANRR